MTTMNNVIQKHNSKTTIISTIYHQNLQLLSKNCPMDGYCLSECLIDKASVNTTTNKYSYGTYENTLK